MFATRRHHIVGAALIMATVALPALADGKAYISAQDVPVLLLIAPPPANDSSKTRMALRHYGDAISIA